MINFKIGEKVKMKDSPKWKGEIWDCWINQPENIKFIDGEPTYVVKVEKPGRQPHMVTTYTFNESELDY